MYGTRSEYYAGKRRSVFCTALELYGNNFPYCEIATAERGIGRVEPLDELPLDYPPRR